MNDQEAEVLLGTLQIACQERNGHTVEQMLAEIPQCEAALVASGAGL